MVTVSIITGGKRTEVQPLAHEPPPVVPAQNLMIEIQSELLGAKVLLNDELVPVIPGGQENTGYILVDGFRSTGFHRLCIAGELYCFGTADAKLELDGILKILAFIEEHGLSWGRQLVFSNGNAVRDTRVDYAWLRSVAPRGLELCDAIAERPVTTAKKDSRVSVPRGGRVLLAETMSLLRGNARALLEEHPRGLIQIEDRRWMPGRVVVQTESVSCDTVGNRRATRLLLDLYQLTQRLVSQGVPKQQGNWLRSLAIQIQGLLDRYPFRVLVRSADRLPREQSVQERADARYAEVFRIHDELLNELTWEPTRKITDRYAYVGFSDEIYQAFVAVLLSKAFGVERVVPYLKPDLEGPCFRSDGWEIYYDTCPPSPEYSSWRDGSSRPARLTPDYCIVDLTASRGILGDAKYRANGGAGRLPSTALNDCQVYMQHFNTSAFVVFYPGPEQLIEEISGRDSSGANKTILEVSITPFDGVLAWVTDTVRPKIEAHLEPLEARQEV